MHSPLDAMYQDLRKGTYELFAANEGEGIARAVDWGIMILIAANVVVVMIETIDPIAAQYRPQFRVFEIVSVVIFTIEYAGRLWTAVEHPEYDGGVIGSRVRLATQPLLIVDLLAILPFYLAFAGISAELRFLRALRLVRLLRLLKLARYSESLKSFSAVIERKKPDLAVAGFANLMLLTVSSSAMYFAEHQAQPDTFSSIPQTLWWGVITLTTVGYGNTVPVTPLGQMLGALTAILGIGLFALPASILASGFLEAARDKDKTCPHCGEDINQSELYDYLD